MGKYMRRKSKLTGEVAVMDVSQSALGVRTRAKTLALQRLQSATATTVEQPPPAAAQQDPELSYLQLRSRRLEKPLFQNQNSGCRRQNPDAKNPNPRSSSRLRNGPRDSGSAGSVSIGKKEAILGEGEIENQVVGKKDETEEKTFELGVEASCGENNLELEANERGTRESTPCSLIRDPNNLSAPGSSTKPRNFSDINERMLISIQRSLPTAVEIEEFFARGEQEQQKRFAEKYNFDVVNDVPLAGRYEWVKVQQ